MKIIVLACTLSVFSPAFSQNIDLKLRKLLNEKKVYPLEIKQDLSSPLFKLGQKLFEDVELSGNRNISCQSCHHPDMGSSDDLPLPVGEGGNGLGQQRTLGTGHVIPRNSPHLFNLKTVAEEVIFWDGRVRFNKKDKTFITPEPGLNGKDPVLKEYVKPLSDALSAQAMFPPTSHHEMRGEIGTNEIANASTNLEVWRRLSKRIVNKRDYEKHLKESFPDTRLENINFGHLAEALGNFQGNRFVVTKTPFDWYLKGVNNALSEKSKRGAILFYSKARCFECHTGNNLTDNKFHNVAFPQVGPGKESNGNDRGQFLVTKDMNDLYKFKTPGLRNVSITGPYGHSGSYKTLEEVVKHYVNPKLANYSYLSPFQKLPYELEIEWQNMIPRLETIDSKLGGSMLELNENEVLQIVSFLRNGLSQKKF